MGLFGDDADRLQRKLQSLTEAVTASFNNVKKDIIMQNEWISHLHASNKELKDNHDSHKMLTSAEFERLRVWIAHLHDLSRKQENDIEALKKSLAEALNAYNKHIIELYKQTRHEEMDVRKLTKELRSEIQPDLQALKSELRTEIMPELKRLIDSHREETERLFDSHREHTQRLVHSHKEDTERLITQKIESMPAVKEIQMVPKPSLLTYPEQKLLNQLLNEADPVTYEQLAQKTGHSINTLRVVMNALKKRNLIEEHLLPSGIKLFNARNKERIKKIYNLDYI